MEPKTKLQKEIVALNAKLRPLTEKHEQWAIAHSFDKIGHRYKHMITCFECGHQFEDSCELYTSIEKKADCPVCKSTLQIRNSKAVTYDDYSYCCFIGTCGRFQVIRYLWIHRVMKIGNETRYFAEEVTRQWLSPSGEIEVISRLRKHNMGNYFEKWVPGELEIRKWGNIYKIQPNSIYPGRRYIPIIKRNGFRGKFYGYAPIYLFSQILADSTAETLLKAGQGKLFDYYLEKRDYEFNIKKYWPSVKICIRNDYKPKDVSMWIDYLDLLYYFGKDLHNHAYVCPPDLRKVHNELSRRKRNHIFAGKKASKREYLEQLDKIYKKEKGHFFDILIKHGNIKITPLKSVTEFLIEGDTLAHCVFSNQYYAKKNSLLLSASVKGERMETVELSLPDLKIKQCRGFDNKNSRYHNSIIALVEQNKHLFREKIKPPRKKRHNLPNKMTA